MRMRVVVHLARSVSMATARRVESAEATRPTGAHRLPALERYCEPARQRQTAAQIGRSGAAAGRFGWAWFRGRRSATMWPVDAEVDVRYATSGDARLAYTVRGTGPHEIVYVASWMSNQDVEDGPDFGLFFERLGLFASVVRYDQRGSGLSDPVSFDDLPTLEGWTDDLHAVIEAAAIERAVVMADGLAGTVAALYAATHPERTRALILVNSYATIAWSADYPAGMTTDEHERFVEHLERVWGTGRFARALLPSVDIDETQQRELARFERQSMTPSTVGAIFRRQYATDVRAILPVISAPTLVLHAVDNRLVPVGHGRYLAQHIPHARLVELPGADTAVFVGGDAHQIVTEEIEEFVTGTRGDADHSRMLTTLLFTDVAGSTERVAAIGDRAWRSVLDRHDHVVRRQLERFSGHEDKFLGDGMLATFDGPARAIRCGIAIRDAARQIGVEVRVGIHTGEVERRGTELAGIAVHLASRVCEAARPGEVLVSRTLVDLVAGSDITFDDRGEHELKGIPATWRLFAVTT
jgi:class 3 adenylate cyclase